VRNGTLKLTTHLYDIRVPSTAQAVLAWRIDRLRSAESRTNAEVTGDIVKSFVVLECLR
jgi:hypothetical protein